MTYFVAFDGSPLSEAALRRADRYADALDIPLLSETVVPAADAAYAREHGWLDEGEAFDADVVTDAIAEQVHGIAPDATVHLATVDYFAPEGAIAKRLRERARAVNAEVVFVGSDNAGHVVSGISSIGQRVTASAEAYDVHIVRHEENVADPGRRADT